MPFSCRWVFLLTLLLSNSSCSAFSLSKPAPATASHSPTFHGIAQIAHRSGFIPLYASTLKNAGDVETADSKDDENEDEDAHDVNGGVAPAATADATYIDMQVNDDEDFADDVLSDEEKEEERRDAANMQLAIQQANSRGGERGARSPFPKPIVGAVIVTKDGRVIGKGRASYKKDAVRAAIADAGIVATPLREWCVTWPSDQKLRRDVAESTLYVTLEPSTERQGYVC